MSSRQANTPVLVGIGSVMQRFENSREAREPVALMIEALRVAGADSAPALLTQIERIYVPKGRWQYRNPGRRIASAVGSPHAVSVLAQIGILQQSLIGDACRRIAEGEISAAAVVGGEAGYRILRAKIAGETLADLTDDTEPHQILRPHEPMRSEPEVRAGLSDAVGLYAVIESAYRAAHGWSVDQHRNRLAALYAGFSEIAATNPHAWKREPVTAKAIRDPSPKNPMIAFPYTKYHVSSWSVDQASALLFCSTAKAEALGVPPEKWIYPLASAESNFMMNVSQRPSIADVPGARIAGRSALESAGKSAEELDLIELYTCFPVAVETYADALGLSLERSDLTVTGGMPFAGGPLNNYVVQSTCRMAELLRARSGTTGLVTSVSGILTKQGFGLWTSDPVPSPYRFIDVTERVAAEVALKDVALDYSGPATIAGYTVLHRAPQPDRAVALVDIDRTRRAVVWSDQPEIATALQSAKEFVGQQVRASGTELHLDG